MEPDPFKAFEFAKEVATQLISLSTGIIALTITFSKDFLASSSAGVRRLAVIGWGFYFVSLIFGVWTLMALTGNLEPLEGPPILSIRRSNVAIPAALQVLSFLAGTGITIGYGLLAIIEDRGPSRAKRPSTASAPLQDGVRPDAGT
jgi:hypothetical protein